MGVRVRIRVRIRVGVRVGIYSVLGFTFQSSRLEGGSRVREFEGSSSGLAISGALTTALSRPFSLNVIGS